MPRQHLEKVSTAQHIIDNLFLQICFVKLSKKASEKISSLWPLSSWRNLLHWHSHILKGRRTWLKAEELTIFTGKTWFANTLLLKINLAENKIAWIPWKCFVSFLKTIFMLKYKSFFFCKNILKHQKQRNLKLKL